ncbi:MAG: AMP-dependent synthetase [Promethearchaeota archaeon]|nr:MAG: AMP-dependent synthetase [Candidatus Lokiarchaeota archaeon]
MSEQDQESIYASRFWKKNWDEGLEDLDPKVYNKSFPDVIKNTFERVPDKIALTFQGIEITFAELDKYSNQFANMLIENGFKKGDLVAINLPNIPEYLITVIGTHRIGCIASGLSPLMSEEQMQYQLKDLGSGGKQVALVTLDAIFAARLTKIAPKLPELKLVIATSVIGMFPKDQQEKIKALRDIPSGEVTPLEGKIVLDFHDDVLAKFSTDSPDIQVTADDIAFIQYTGGTTGPPKGAMLTHRNSVSNLYELKNWLGMEFGAGVALSGNPFFHIAGLIVGQACIFNGMTQCLIADPRDALYICNQIKQYKPRIIVSVPSLYQILMNFRKFKRLDHSTLEICISGAAPFPVESQKQLESIIGEGKVLEVLGITECSPLVAGNPSKGKRKLGSIGLPILNTKIKIVDPETGEEVLLGEAGEICVKGPQVTIGYYNKPEETKNAFDDEGFFHTGDVALMDEDGYMRIVDRIKDMIIVGGFKVFSSKVEEILTEHPAIGNIALIGKPNPERPGSEIVNAYIQLDPIYEYDGNEDALNEDITNFAKEKCAPYEVPKKIHIMEELPLTAVGKVDKKVLRK